MIPERDLDSAEDCKQRISTQFGIQIGESDTHHESSIARDIRCTLVEAGLAEIADVR
jgi:hypothetical protein